MQTELTLSIGGIPPMSARGCTQELTAIPQGEFRRTIGGELIFVGNLDHKYKSTIRCQDQAVIATEGLRVGDVVHVGCIQSLGQKINPDENSITLSRSAVLHSIYVMNDKNEQYKEFSSDCRTITLNEPHGVLFAFFRPELKMRVTSFTLTMDEWKMKSGWTLELNEV
ncbi:MAG: hypothetical protein LBJ89_05040 [Holosporales bacterium]|jgi:hypothetical protein|nr:hypothetical protein [Holosporales bacterium]